VFDATRLATAAARLRICLLTTEMPAHNHPATAAPHHHNTGLALAAAFGAATNAPVDDGSASNGHALTSDTTVSVTTSNTGGGAHNNVQPSVTRNIIIYAGV
jgi:microcystin-dependent protein